MDSPIWDILKTIFSWVGLIASFVLGLVFKSYNKHRSKTDEHDIRITKLEVKFDGVKSEVKEIKEELKAIKDGVDKLVEHMLNKNK